MRKRRLKDKVRLGIDFGTTRTHVARVESGNYPLITFETEGGEAKEWFPSIVAGRGLKRLFGWKALSKQTDPDWEMMRSLKGYLSQAKPSTSIELGGEKISVLALLVEFLKGLREALLENSNLQLNPSTRLEAMVGVPANANSNQRFLTLEGFRRAGFDVLGMTNEPSAAGVEYAFRHRQQTGFRQPEYLLIYDLGGGTFDLSAIQMDERSQRVIATAGLERLGGDDFDAILAGLALSRAGLRPELQSDFLLLEECREKKEALSPNTKKIHIDLSCVTGEDLEVTVTTDEFYRGCIPLVERTLTEVEAIFSRSSLEAGHPDWSKGIGLYLVGGAAELPLVARVLRERYGKRLRKSLYPRAAVAIGLAIAADERMGLALEDQFTRHFGVWREAEGGRRMIFDPIFLKGTVLPSPQESPLVRSRRYEPVHNIGHFRYMEARHVNEQGFPTGDIAVWDEVRFPFDPALSGETDLSDRPIERLDRDCEPIQAEEVYTCDHQGIVNVTILNRSTGLQRSYQLRRFQ